MGDDFEMEGRLITFLQTMDLHILYIFVFFFSKLFTPNINLLSATFP